MCPLGSFLNSLAVDSVFSAMFGVAFFISIESLFSLFRTRILYADLFYLALTLSILRLRPIFNEIFLIPLIPLTRMLFVTWLLFVEFAAAFIQRFTVDFETRGNPIVSGARFTLASVVWASWANIAQRKFSRGFDGFAAATSFSRLILSQDVFSYIEKAFWLGSFECFNTRAGRLYFNTTSRRMSLLST